MNDFQRIMESVVGTLLVLALLGLGTLFGLSLSLLSQAISGDRLFALWGPALGAGIGACATLAVAIYNQHRTEMRELREPLNELIVELESAADEMLRLERTFESPPNPTDYNSRIAGRGILQVNIGNLANRIRNIEPSAAFPYTLRSQIRTSIRAASSRLGTALTIARDDLPELEGAAYVAAWGRIKGHVVASGDHIFREIEVLVRLV